MSVGWSTVLQVASVIGGILIVLGTVILTVASAADVNPLTDPEDWEFEKIRASARADVARGRKRLKVLVPLLALEILIIMWIVASCIDASVQAG